MAKNLILCAASAVAVALSNGATFAVLCGIGLLGRRALGLGAAGADWFTAFWLGFAATIWFLILWNFAFPINAVACLLVVSAGVFGIYQARADVAQRVTRAPSTLVLLIVAMGLWLANLASGPLLYWDSGLYHLRAAKWAHAYAAVPGLANLYGPIGFNNPSTLYAALLTASPWGRFAHHVATSSLLQAMLAQTLIAWFWFRRSSGVAPGRLAAVFLLPAVMASMSKELAASFATDLPMTLTLLGAGCLIYDRVVQTRSNESEGAHQIISITALLALAVCLKFNAVAFAVPAWLLLVAIERAQARPWRPIVVSACVAAGMGLSWMARGIVLSGYPMFPVPTFAAPVDWRAPLEHAEAEYAYIIHSGRNTATALGTIPNLDRFGTWFPRWLPRLVHEEPFAVLVPLLVAAAAFIAYWRYRRKETAGDLRRGWLAVVPAVVAIAAWLLFATEPRYALAYFWLLAAICGAQAVRAFETVHDAGQGRRTVSSLVVFVAASAALVMPILQRPWQHPLRAIVAGNISVTPIGSQTAPSIPALAPFYTSSGLELLVPRDTGGRCLDAPLLCTPNPAANLRLRDPKNLAKGFAVDGAWQMEDWPYDWVPNFLHAWRELERPAGTSQTTSK